MAQKKGPTPRRRTPRGNGIDRGRGRVQRTTYQPGMKKAETINYGTGCSMVLGKAGAVVVALALLGLGRKRR